MPTMIKGITLCLFIPLFSCAQVNPDKSKVDNCLKSFYSLLFREDVSISEFESVYANASESYDAELYVKENCSDEPKKCNKLLELRSNHSDTARSYVAIFMRRHLDELGGKITLSEVSGIIERSIPLEIGMLFTVSVDLELPNERVIHFDLNRDDPMKIQWIWLDNGDLFDDVISGKSSPQKLRRIATIRPSERIVPIRDSPWQGSRVVSEFSSGEVFYYTPIGNSVFWPVYLKARSEFIGWIESSKILKFEDSSIEVQKWLLKKVGQSKEK